MNSHRFSLWILIASLAGGLAACAPAPAGVSAVPLTFVTTLDQSGVFAASPDRRLLAYGKQGLQLLDRSAGTLRQLDAGQPLALAWRHDGQRLAAAFVVSEQQGRLLVYTADGEVVEQTELPGLASAIAWSSHGDLLVAGFRAQRFSFGANLSQWLIHGDGREFRPVTLGDTTLKLKTFLQVQERLSSLLQVVFSPSGDELVLTRLHDPPQFPAYLQLVHRNWQVAGERKLLDLPLQPAGLAWSDLDDSVLVRSGSEPWQRVELWPAAEQQPLSTGTTPPWPDAWGGTPRLQRFNDGGYLLAVGTRLYAGADLASPPGATGDEHLWALRRWRFTGLITPEEFRKVRP